MQLSACDVGNESQDCLDSQGRDSSPKWLVRAFRGMVPLRAEPGHQKYFRSWPKRFNKSPQSYSFTYFKGLGGGIASAVLVSSHTQFQGMLSSCYLSWKLGGNGALERHILHHGFI